MVEARINENMSDGMSPRDYGTCLVPYYFYSASQIDFANTAELELKIHFINPNPNPNCKSKLLFSISHWITSTRRR